MIIQLTPEQEKRVQAVLGGGAYHSVEEVLDAGLAARDDVVRQFGYSLVTLDLPEVAVMRFVELSYLCNDTR